MSGSIISRVIFADGRLSRRTRSKRRHWNGWWWWWSGELLNDRIRTMFLLLLNYLLQGSGLGNAPLVATEPTLCPTVSRVHSGKSLHRTATFHLSNGGVIGHTGIGTLGSSDRDTKQPDRTRGYHGREPHRRSKLFIGEFFGS